MRILLIILLFILSLTTAKGQTASLNKLDSDGKKDGKWAVYYNKKGKEVNDSTQAVYYRYTYYIHGKDYIHFDWYNENDSIISSSDGEQSVALKMLDGTYKILNEAGSLKSIHVFNQGEYVSYSSFYPSGKIQTYCNFDNQHFEQGEFEPQTYCKRAYNNGTVKYYYMRNPPGSDSWSFYKSSFDSTAITNKTVIVDSTFATVTHYAGKQTIRQMGMILIKGQPAIVHGIYKYWYANGQIKEEGRYDYNKKIGDWKYWNKDGIEHNIEIDFDQLNKTNEDGEKTGWWITYLNEHLKVLQDSVGATHCMYNYYTGKFFHYKYGKGLGSKKYPVHFQKTGGLKLGNFNLLDGDYFTKYKSGKIRSVLSAANGILLAYKEYYPGGQLHVHIIYSKECGVPIRHCLKEYDKHGNLIYDGANMVPQDRDKYN